MTHTFLLEIGLEEMPSRFIVSSVTQLKTRFEQFLTEQNLSFEKVDVFSTPRRLAIKVTGLPEKQEDKTEILKGPSKKAGMDEEGNWTKAALGFARGKKVSEQDLFLDDVNGIKYVFAKVDTKGKRVEDILSEVGPVIENMDFPISMRWADHSFRYLRPVHWIIALLDDQVIPFSVFDIQSGRKTRGHRFLGHEADILNADAYVDMLKKESVLVDRQARKEMIAFQIKELENKEGWHVPANERLLNEVTDMVEYPTAFFGSYSSDYLAVPDRALVTTMRDHQRYFDVRDDKGTLLPYFVAIRNGNDHFIDEVQKGNEKVLRARLADAAFFFEEDLKETIDDALERVKRVTFYEGMGSLYDKSIRVKHIASILGDLFCFSDEQKQVVQRAAELSKFDLVTNMVDEFPELQGIMGEIYAVRKGESKEVGQAIREQYMPLSSNGKLPESEAGALLSLSDKLDTLIQFFHAGVLPTGSADPYALRRQAYGVIRIIRSRKWVFPIQQLKTKLSKATLKTEPQHMGMLTEFLLQRLKQYLSEDGYRYDVIDAVLASQQTEVLVLGDTAKVIQSHLADEDFKSVIESLTRVSKLAQKAENEADINLIDPSLFETDSEMTVFKETKEAIDKIKNALDKNEEYEVLRTLHEPIDQFFDDNMIMADNESVKSNRLTLLKVIHSLVLHFADVDKLVIK